MLKFEDFLERGDESLNAYVAIFRFFIVDCIRLDTSKTTSTHVGMFTLSIF